MTNKVKQKECFVIMPISDPDGYAKGHFSHVYKDIITPACEQANLHAVRADDVKQTNLIHLDMLQKLIEAPISVCDLSTRNPNVMFELGIRQAFDRPVVLIQEKGTPKIFDIAPLRYLEYSKEMKYHEVMKSQEELKEALEATLEAEGVEGNINSIVKLMALGRAAQIPDVENQKESLALEYIQAEMRDMRRMIEVGLHESRGSSKQGSISTIEYERISRKLDKIANNPRMSLEKRHDELRHLMQETEELMFSSNDEMDHHHFRRLMERIHRTLENIA